MEHMSYRPIFFNGKLTAERVCFVCDEFLSKKERYALYRVLDYLSDKNGLPKAEVYIKNVCDKCLIEYFKKEAICQQH